MGNVTSAVSLPSNWNTVFASVMNVGDKSQ